MTKTVQELQKSLAFLFRFDAFGHGQIALQEFFNKLPKLPHKLLVYILRINIAATALLKKLSSGYSQITYPYVANS